MMMGARVLRTVEELEERLSRPNAADVAAARRLDGDVGIIGASGKMGPSLARRVKRAIDKTGVRQRVVAVSPDFEPGTADALASAGIETIECDCLDRGAVARLPRFPNVLYLAGRK